jgi:hypothetical protein
VGVEQPGVKLNIHLHLAPRSKNEWSYTSIPQYVFTAWYLVKHRDDFTFTTPEKNQDMQAYFSFPHLPIQGNIKKFPGGRLERELQMIQLSATRCNYVDIL